MKKRYLFKFGVLFVAATMLLTMSSCRISLNIPLNANNKYDVINPTFSTQIGDNIYYCCRTGDNEVSVVKFNKKTEDQQILTKYLSDSDENTIFAVGNHTLCYSSYQNPEYDDDYSGNVYYLFNLTTQMTEELISPDDFPSGVKSISFVGNKFYFMYPDFDYYDSGNKTPIFDLYSLDAGFNVKKVESKISDYVVESDSLYFSKLYKITKKNLVTGANKNICDIPCDVDNFNKYKNRIFYEKTGGLHILNLDDKKEAIIEYQNIFDKGQVYNVKSFVFDKEYFYTCSETQNRIERISYDGKDVKFLKSCSGRLFGQTGNNLCFIDGEGTDAKLCFIAKDGVDIMEFEAPVG